MSPFPMHPLGLIIRPNLDNPYEVVGGYALAAYGLPRYTGDLDAWVWM